MLGNSKLGITRAMPPEDEDNQQVQTGFSVMPVDSKWTPRPNQVSNPTSAHTVKRPPEGWLAYMTPEQRLARAAKKLVAGDRMTVYPQGGYFVSVKKEFKEWLAKRLDELKNQ